MTSAESLTTQDIELLVSQFVANEKKVDINEIDINLPFAELGLDSVAAVSISGELEDRLGVELEPTLLWDYPTIADLSRHLHGLVAAHATAG